MASSSKSKIKTKTLATIIDGESCRNKLSVKAYKEIVSLYFAAHDDEVKAIIDTYVDKFCKGTDEASSDFLIKLIDLAKHAGIELQDAFSKLVSRNAAWTNKLCCKCVFEISHKDFLIFVKNLEGWEFFDCMSDDVFRRLNACTPEEQKAIYTNVVHKSLVRNSPKVHHYSFINTKNIVIFLINNGDNIRNEMKAAFLKFFEEKIIKEHHDYYIKDVFYILTRIKHKDLQKEIVSQILLANNSNLNAKIRTAMPKFKKFLVMV